MERVGGNAPPSLDWQSNILLLCYTRMVNAPSTSHQSKPSKSAFKNYFSRFLSSLIYQYPGTSLIPHLATDTSWLFTQPQVVVPSIFWRRNVDFNHLATILQTVLGNIPIMLISSWWRLRESNSCFMLAKHECYHYHQTPIRKYYNILSNKLVDT